MLACGHRDARLVGTFTDTDSGWAEPAKKRFLLGQVSTYFVPSTVFCDKTMVTHPLDASYLETMDSYLKGKLPVPPIADDRFWCSDVPPPSQAGESTAYDVIRTHWTVSSGFGRVITFTENDALRVDDTQAALYDVFVTGPKTTRYRCPLGRFVKVPSLVEDLKLPAGLCLRLPRILRYLGSEVERAVHYAGYEGRLQWALRLEVVHAVVVALQVDYLASQIVWVVSEECIALFREFADAPEVRLPAGADGEARLVRIGKVAQYYDQARKLGDEYLFELRHFPTDGVARWAILGNSGFVLASSYTGPLRDGKLVNHRSLGPSLRSQKASSGYVRGFGGRERRSSGGRYGGLSTVIPDSEVRGDRTAGGLVKAHLEREGGWNVRKPLSIALSRVNEAERRSTSLEERFEDLEVRVKDVNKRADMWIAQCDRLVGGRSVSVRPSEVDSRYSEGASLSSLTHRSRPLRSGSAMATDASPSVGRRG